MTKRGVYEVINEKDLPIDRRCIKNKWIFKVKIKRTLKTEEVEVGSQATGERLNLDLSTNRDENYGILASESYKLMTVQIKTRVTFWNITAT
jgi:hypothetical protein